MADSGWWAALGLGGPSLASRMQDLSRMQRERFARGERGPPMPGSQEAMAGLDVAGSIDLGGILAGPKALTAPLEQLTKAQKAAARGWKPQTIWEKYGWYEGPDQQWRFEIDDSAARTSTLLRSAVTARKNANLSNRGYEIPRAASLEEVFRHPELERAYYPTREKAPDIYYADLPGQLRGQYQTQAEGRLGPGEITIANRIAGKNLGEESERSTMLHELQHMIQEREGFAGGANPKEFQPAYEQAKRRLDERRAAMLAHDRMKYLKESPIEASETVANKRGLDAEKIRRLVDEYPEDELFESLTKLRNELDQLNPYEKYRRTAGEAEARAVQARRDYTPEQRRATIPLADYDVPLSELIVRRR